MAAGAASLESGIGKIELPGRTRTFPPALFALALGSFALGTTEFLPAALLPTIASDLDVTVAAAGLLISGYALGVTLLTPVLSAVASGMGLPRKQLLMGLMAVFFLTNLLGAFAPGYASLLALRFLTAFSHGLYFAAASTVAASLVPKGREAQAIAILFGGLTIAMATIVPTGALLGQMVGWRAAFAATACLGLLTVAGIAIYVPAIPTSENRLSLGRQLSALRYPPLLLALAVTTVGYAGTFATFTYLAATLEEISGFSPFVVTILFGALGIGVTIGNFAGGRAADYGIFPSIVGLYALIAISLLVFWFVAPYPVFAALAFLAFSVAMLSPGAGLQLLALEQARRGMPGSEDVAAGLNQSAFNFGIASGAFIGSQVVASPLGLGSTPLASVALLLAAIGLAAWAWRIDVRGKSEPISDETDDAFAACEEPASCSA